MTAAFWTAFACLGVMIVLYLIVLADRDHWRNVARLRHPDELEATIARLRSDLAAAYSPDAKVLRFERKAGA